MTLDEVNAADRAGFAAALGSVFEHAPWVAEQAWEGRPFATVAGLHLAMFARIEAAAPEVQLAFLNEHAELAGVGEMGAAYRERFGFPFVVCVRRHTRWSLLRQLARRVEGEGQTEREAALREVFLITRLGLAEIVTGPGMPQVTGTLTTHVLNSALGRPAEGVPVALFELDGGDPVLRAKAVTNADGRTDAPLLGGAPLRIGRYELRFEVAAHFARVGLPAADPPFYDEIPIRFAIAEPESHYHVPLLLSPGAYSTYRGS
jgi:2-oxo-4-hydroxy-4-carboxy-5-ureidoimidazoline decarboxylase